MRADIPEMARGKWKGILSNFGVPDAFLSGKHGPCLFCGGVDRARWDNKDGRGTFICGQCGSGDGVALLMKLKGWDFKATCAEIAPVLGVVQPEAIRQGRSADEQREARMRLWQSAKPFAAGDATDVYLRSRGIDWEGWKTVRTMERLRYDDVAYYPAMVAVVQGPDGVAVNLHRTWLSGGGKAPVDEPRKTLDGTIPEGSAIRLGPANSILGIAEGIETALAASILFELPVWSAINAGRLEKWIPPEGVEEVHVFVDHDRLFAGQAAGYALAKRLAHKGLHVNVRMPPEPGDWADVLVAERARVEVAA